MAPKQTTSFAAIGRKVASIPASGTRVAWLLVFSLFAILALLFLYTVTLVFTIGVGVMGINIPVAWDCRLSMSCGGSESATPAH